MGEAVSRGSSEEEGAPNVAPSKRRGGAKKGATRGGAKAIAEAARGGAHTLEPPPPGGEQSAAEASGGVGALLDKARVLRDAMPELRAALDRIEAVAVEDAKVSVDAFYATFVRGGVTVHLGPNAVSAFRTPSAFRLDVTPQAAERGPTSLKLGVDVPVDPAADLRVSLTGGPVPLAALGLRKGDLGLLDVETSLVEADIAMRLTGDGRRASAEVDAKLHELAVEHRALSSEPVRGADLRLRGEVVLETDGSSLVVERGELGVGRVGVTFAGTLRRPGEGWALRGRVEVPPTPCQAALDALPAGLTPLIAGTRMDGSFSLVTAVDFDSSRPDDADVHFALGNGCKVTSVPPEIDVKRFKARFRRRVYGPSGERVELEMGPGSEGWVPYGAISPFMTAAVLTTEDGGFRHHRGFDPGAIRNSIRDNLREGRFLRGASTITMQTVKNLYLEREKTLGRKIQEAVLTVYIEQALEKEDILELYFNCIEFGPMLYGIGPAAGHYFHSTPGELSLGQALFLSSILPSPKVNRFGPDGRLKAGWMSYLRKLMQIMVKRRLIDESELRVGASEWLVFGEPAPAREEAAGLDSVDEVYPFPNGP
ncbi:MAG TPA: biosynthetic peptidoglycan transglycosylase [Polyangiaceae bacterium]|nr:biosynthetic peptidoglycan transglycosylase [Polyangiaceae bacterium]